MKAAVSVIIPVYNVEDYIERCAVSLFEQTMESIEFVFVDDASTDKSMDVLNAIKARYPNRDGSIKIVTHEKNQGLPEARRTGLLHASGDYVIHCDSDDWVEQTMYEDMYGAAIKENADIVACNMWIDRGTSKIENKYPYAEETKDTLKQMYLLNGVYSTLCNKLVRRSLYTQNHIEPLKDVFMWEDFSISFRLRLHSCKTVVVSKAYYHYMINRGESVRMYNEKKIQQQLFCADYFEKYIQDVFPEERMSFNNAIHYVQFMAKLGYFTNVETQDFSKWKQTNKESNRYLMTYNTIPLSRRIVFYLGLHVSPKLAFLIYDESKKILR